MAERRVIKGWVYERGDDGQIRPVGPAGGQMPAKPTFDLERPKTLAEIGQTGAQTNNTQANTQRTVVQTRGDQLDNSTKQKNLSQNPISDRDQAMINTMRLGQGDLPGVLKDITAAQAAVDRFKPAPGRGSSYSWAVPEDNDWPITAWAKNRVADVAGITQEDKDAYQTLLGLQNQGVLNSQLAQKGPQTESDAARMKLTGVSPNKGTNTNAQLLAEQQYDVMMKQQRPGFYEYWANRLGSTHALNGSRQSADQVWNDQYQRGLQKLRSSPSYRAVSGQRTAPPRKQATARFLGWEK